MLGAAVGGYTDLLGVAVNEPLYGASSEAAIWSSLFFALSVLAVSILNAVLTVVAFLSLTVQALAVLDGDRVGIGASIRQGLGHFWRFLVMAIVAVVMFSVVATAAYVAVMIAVFGFAVVAGVLLVPMGDNPVIMIGVTGLLLLLFFAAMVVFLLPVLALTARWLAAPVVLVAERRGPLAALGRSWRLTQRQTWRGILMVILLAVLNFFVLGLPMLLLQWLLFVALPPEWLEVLSGLVTGIGFLFNMLWQPFLAAALVLLYFDMRVRSESYDLELQIAGLEAELRPLTLP